MDKLRATSQTMDFHKRGKVNVQLITPLHYKINCLVHTCQITNSIIQDQLS